MSSRLDRLRRRIEETPRDPWLIHRRGWDWHWRSWERVADQVARGVALLEDRSAEHESNDSDRFEADPDGVAALVAARVADVPVGVARSTLPSVRGPLDRESLERLPPIEPPPPARGTVGATTERPSIEPPGDDWPGSRRPILCTGPLSHVGPRSTEIVSTCLDWSIEHGAAWVLEPDAPSFAHSAAWARPHLIVAEAAGLAALGERLAGRWRRTRLRRVLVVGAAGEPDALDWIATLDPSIEVISDR